MSLIYINKCIHSLFGGKTNNMDYYYILLKQLYIEYLILSLLNESKK